MLYCFRITLLLILCDGKELPNCSFWNFSMPSSNSFFFTLRLCLNINIFNSPTVPSPCEMRVILAPLDIFYFLWISLSISLMLYFLIPYQRCLILHLALVVTISSFILSSCQFLVASLLCEYPIIGMNHETYVCAHAMFFPIHPQDHHYR